MINIYYRTFSIGDSQYNKSLRQLGALGLAFLLLAPEDGHVTFVFHSHSHGVVFKGKFPY